MKQPTIKLNGNNYNIAFNYGTIRELANVWGINSPSKVEKKILDVLNKSVPKPKAKAVELTFNDIDVLRDTFYAAITTVNNDVPFSADEMMTEIMSTEGVLAEFTNHYINSLPKQEPVNPNVRKGQKKQ